MCVLVVDLSGAQSMPSHPAHRCRAGCYVHAATAAVGGGKVGAGQDTAGRDATDLLLHGGERGASCGQHWSVSAERAHISTQVLGLKNRALEQSHCLTHLVQTWLHRFVQPVSSRPSWLAVTTSDQAEEAEQRRLCLFLLHLRMLLEQAAVPCVACQTAVCCTTSAA